MEQERLWEWISSHNVDGQSKLEETENAEEVREAENTEVDVDGSKDAEDPWDELV